MRFKEWPSLGSQWRGPTWHRELPEVTPQSWAMFTPIPQAAFPSLHAHWLQQLGGPGLAGTRPPTQVGPARGLILRHLEKLAGHGFRLPHFIARSVSRPTF